MPLKVAINGFGRIGRLVFRAGLNHPDLIEFVGINDLVPPPNLAYLLKYDSTHGRFNGTVEAKEDGIVVETRQPDETHGRNYIVNYHLRVPRSWLVYAENINGNTTVETFDNAVEVGVSQGRILYKNLIDLVINKAVLVHLF